MTIWQTRIRIITLALTLSSCGVNSTDNSLEQNRPDRTTQLVQQPTDTFRMLDRPANRNHSVVLGHRLVGILKASKTGMDLGGVTQVFQDRDDRYWIANRKRVYLYDSRLNTLTPYTLDHDVDRLGQTVDGRVWACGFAKGLYGGISFFDEGAWQRLQDPEVNGKVASMFSDSQGNIRLIVGPSLLGYSNEQARFTILERYKERFETGLVDRDGNMWLADVGIVSYDAAHGRWDHAYRSLGFASSVSILYEDRFGRIWAGGWKGNVAVYDKRSRSWTTYVLKDHIVRQNPDRDFVGLNDIYQDKAGRMVFATWTGLLLLDEGQKKWEVWTGGQTDVPDECFGSIVEDRAGNIWIGTTKGVVVLAQ